MGHSVLNGAAAEGISRIHARRGLHPRTCPPGGTRLLCRGQPPLAASRSRRLPPSRHAAARCIHLERPCPASPALAQPPGSGPTPSCKMLFSARGLARPWPKTGLQVVAACLQKAATGRPEHTPRLTVLDGPWRIAAPAMTGTPSPAPDTPQSPVRGSYTRESGPLCRPWNGVRPCTPADVPSSLLPLRSSCPPPRGRRLSALDRPATAAARHPFHRGSPCTDSQKGIFKAGVVHCSALSSRVFRS